MTRKTMGSMPRPHDRTYFLLFHGAAWLVYAAVYYEEVLRYQRPSDYWQVVLAATVTGSLICWPLAVANLRVRERSLAVKVAVATVTSLLAAVAWSVVRGAHFAYVYSPGESVLPSLSGGAVFRATNTFLFWNALYLAYDNYKIAKHNEIQTLTAQALARDNQLKLLSYQLNPHFLFNVLNSVAALVLKKDRQAAHVIVVKLSDFLRYTLDSEPWRKVSLDRELRCVAQYLAIQKVRFQERLQVSYDVPGDLSKATLPNLILQPVVENAIKHTIAKSMSTVSIEITATRDDDALTILIANSFDREQSGASSQKSETGIGLTNVRQRLAAYYGDDADLQLSQADGEYRVILSIPYDVADEDQ